jgi:hypothetical protein
VSTSRPIFTNRAARLDVTFKARLVTLLPAPHRSLQHRPVFTVIALDFIDNVATDFNLCVVIHAMARTAPPSV